jgi:hypothetical protein
LGEVLPFYVVFQLTLTQTVISLPTIIRTFALFIVECSAALLRRVLNQRTYQVSEARTEPALRSERL